MILNDLYPQSQGHAIFDAEYLRNGATYRHSVIEILIGTYTHTPYAAVLFRMILEWSWVT